MWWLPPAVFSNFRKLPLHLFKDDSNLADLFRFLLALYNFDETNVSLIQSHRVENQNVCFLMESGLDDYFIWLDPIKAVQFNVEAASYGCERSAPPTAGQDQ